MTLNHNQIKPYIKDFAFKRLFVEIGWDSVSASQARQISVKEGNFNFTLISQKSGFQVFLHEAENVDDIPNRQTGLKIESKLSRLAESHLIIFTDKAKTKQVWQWSKKEANSAVRITRDDFITGSSGERLAQKLSRFAFSLDEEEQGITILDVVRKNDALFREKVTKRFYDIFKNEHEKFSKQIEGIEDAEKRNWYASLTLNRLMFVYFIQQKGFLNSDVKYLRTKLKETQTVGDDMFYSFYRTFLLRFFHNGLGEPDHSNELIELLGKVPYLNGGLFEKHEIENDYKIYIKDEAFERVFEFFDKYDWHLDTRQLKSDHEINPEVLGYIFEKFINQKQMGAYYTKEDITEYISKNTIIPFLFDRVKEKVAIAFDKKDGIWKLLRENADDYFYDAVKKGVIDENGDIIEVPNDIAVGINDVKQRGNWNKPADEEFGLPTETWREYIARRQRCLEIREKIINGEVCEINDFITYNLDIIKFAKNVVFTTESSDLIKAFYQAIAGRIPEKSNEKFEQGVTVLDPTCGSGAFLFAALNILEPILETCLDRMTNFVEESDILDENSKRFPVFRRVLQEIKKHPNREYFVLKSIIVNNLFGVDIMPDAVEICKLRLFLKLVAQVDADENHPNFGLEPLPDIDFNIRSGNTLVGFANKQAVHEAFGGREQQKLSFDNLAEEFDAKAEITAKVFEQFRLQQIKEGGEITAEDKAGLQTQLRKLSAELDIFLAHEYGINTNKPQDFEKFLKSHQPFHWYSEFYGIIANGGFDVIIGNPPYLETREINYEIKHLETIKTGAIHSACIEKSLSLLQKNGCVSMIVPLAIVSTQRMKIVQNLLENEKSAWYSNYAWRPAKLFDTVNRALTIFVAKSSKSSETFSNNYQKWYSENRDNLINCCYFVEMPKTQKVFWIPKLSQSFEKSLLEKMLLIPQKVSSFTSNLSEHRIYYRSTGGLYWKVFTDFAPAFNVKGEAGHSSRETWFKVNEKLIIEPLVAALSSNTFWYWYSITSNLRDLNPSDVQNFPIPESALKDKDLQKLGETYLDDLKKNSTMLVREQKQTGMTETQSFKIQLSKPIIDEIDRVLAKHYGFTDEELDFIINYDIKYRMGVEK